ncbi:MAG: PaaI family thioesterase [Acidimicrobiia bacterium]
MAEPDRPGVPGHMAVPVSPNWIAHINELRDAAPPDERVELRRLADALRRVLGSMVRTDAPLDEVRAAVAGVEAVAERLGRYSSASLFEGYSEAATSGDPYAFFDHSPVMGRANPLAPPLEMWVDGDVVRGRARFGPAYEGPPDSVHGGYVAAVFDELLGTAQSLSGSPGMTARLTVDYRSPTPLEVDLRLEGRLVGVDGRKISTKGRLYAGDVLCAEAEGLFVTVDFARLAALVERRRARREGSGP